MNNEDFLKIRKNCLASSRDFVSAAGKIRSTLLRHIQYHLAALALEEVGKAEILLMQHVSGGDRVEGMGVRGLDIHVRKLFWAFWSISFGKQLTTKAQVDRYKGMAKTIHSKRLQSLYTDSDSLELAKRRVTKREADELLALARTRLSMEEHREPDFDKTDEEKELIKWFMEVTQDPTKLPLIVGIKSQKKLIEFGGKSELWIKWLKEVFDQNDQEVREIMQKELSRKRPHGKDKEVDKYRVKVKLICDSHSLRTKVLSEWNKQIPHIQLSSDDKHTLYATFVFTKNVPPAALYYFTWGFIRTFVVALNIATKGLIWWNVQRDIEKYYEEMWDLELDLKMEARPQKRLSLDWKSLGKVFLPEHLTGTSILLAYIMHQQKGPLQNALDRYAFGLVLTAKNDVHLRMEPNAFREFYAALRQGMQYSGDWDAKEPFVDFATDYFSKIYGNNSFRQYLELGEKLFKESSPTPDMPEITLTEVFGVKILADLYFWELARNWSSATQLSRQKSKTER